MNWIIGFGHGLPHPLVISNKCQGLFEKKMIQYVPRDAEASCHLVALFILNEHIQPVGIINPKKSFLYGRFHI